MKHDVVVAGAGPVGLFLASELRLAGLAVLVLEREPDPDSPLKHLPFGRRGLSVATVEGLDRRGLLAPLAPGRGQAGHFAGIAFEPGKIDAARWPYRLPGPAEGMLAADMAQLEATLAARAEALGVELRRGLAVEGFEQGEDEVAVRAGGETFRAGWLVGCDGGRSVVRKLGGFDFAGTDPELTGYSVRVTLAEPGALPLGRHYTPTGMYFQMQPGTIAMVEFDGGAFHRAELTPEHVQAVLRRVSGVEATVTALHQATTWTDRARQATRYRSGRVLLAGDAAHIHSPLGGQGLNLGLGDALNLGWKLAAVVKGEAPAGLLESYERERQPVGAEILDWSRVQVALMRPGRAERAMEGILRDLVGTRDGATYFAERVWGLALRYDLGEEHPLAGRSAPDFALAEGPLGELLREGRGVLLDFTTALRGLAGRWGERVRHVAGPAEEQLGLSAVLVRPDGFVAWACDAEPDPVACARAGDRWFGAAGGRP